MASRAWVTLVMLGDSYIPGALVMAHSMKNKQTKYPIVAMVTPDVTKEPLTKVFDQVIEVAYIEYPTRHFKSDKQVEAYNPWIDKSFTKWNCLALDYTEVIFIDADMVILENMDDLFELRAPAACFSSPWQMNLYPYVITPRGTPRNVFIDLNHGDPIRAKDIIYALSLHSVVGGAFLMKLPTGIVLFRDFLEFLHKEPAYGLKYLCHSGSDEMSICEFFARRGVQWTNIHQRHAAIPWKKDWVDKDIKAYHYLNRKPWDMDPEEWDDLKLWWDVAESLFSTFPVLRDFFYPPVTNPLDIELAQLSLSNDVRSLIVSSWSEYHGLPRADLRAKVRKLAEEAFAKWISAIKYADKKESWSNIFFRVLPSDKLNQDLLVEMKNYNNFNGRDGEELLVRICQLIDRRLSKIPIRSGIIPTYDDKYFSMGGRFRTPMTDRILQLIKYRGLEQTALDVLHHFALNKSQFPIQGLDVDWLYSAGVRHEAFVSPLDSVMIFREGVQIHPNFPMDTLHTGEKWLVTLPALEDIVKEILDKIRTALAKGSGTVFLISSLVLDLPKVDDFYVLSS
jgi:glycogenin